MIYVGWMVGGDTMCAAHRTTRARARSGIITASDPQHFNEKSCLRRQARSTRFGN